jgi:AbrB family looped-hinge helix DNA binding protein
MEAVKVGKRGTIIVPAKLRKRYGIEEGALVTAEAREDGVLIRPAIVVPVERYTPERRAEFLLSTATSAKDYKGARKAVEKLGLDPDSIPHRRSR